MQETEVSSTWGCQKSKGRSYPSRTPGTFYDQQKTDTDSCCVHLQHRRAHSCKDGCNLVRPKRRHKLEEASYKGHIPEESNLVIDARNTTLASSFRTQFQNPIDKVQYSCVYVQVKQLLMYTYSGLPSRPEWNIGRRLHAPTVCTTKEVSHPLNWRWRRPRNCAEHVKSADNHCGDRTIAVFWDVTSCSLVGRTRHFWELCCHNVDLFMKRRFSAFLSRVNKKP